MRKIFVTLLLFILLLSCMAAAMPAFAADGATIKMSDAEAKQGEKVTVTATISGNPGIAGLIITPKCDNPDIVFSGAEKGSLSGFNMEAGVNLVFDASSDITANGDLCKVTFTVGANVAPGSYDVYFIVRGCSNIDGEDVTLTAVKGKIHVTCKTHAFGDYTKKDDKSHTHTCSVCGTVENADHNWGSGTVTKTATCKEAGEKSYTCSVCGATKTEVIPKTKDHKFGAWTETKAPTCTAAGEEKRSCSVCGQTETRKVDALGHSFSDPKVTKEPTCTETGTKTGTCTRCGQTTSETIPAKGHDYGEWTQTVAATCTEKGKEERTCAVCGHVDSRSIPKTAHDFEDPVIVKEATLFSEGILEGKCKNCGAATQQTTPCTASNGEIGLTVQTNVGTFAEGTEMAASLIDEGNNIYENLVDILRDNGAVVKAFSMEFQRGEETVSPLAEIEVTVIPAARLHTALYHVAEDGEMTLIEYTINEDGTVTFVTTLSGTFAFVDPAGEVPGAESAEETEAPDTETEPTADETEPTTADTAPADTTGGGNGGENKGTSATLLWIIAMILVAGAAFAAGFFVGKRSGKPDEQKKSLS